MSRKTCLSRTILRAGLTGCFLGLRLLASRRPDTVRLANTGCEQLVSIRHRRALALRDGGVDVTYERAVWEFVDQVNVNGLMDSLNRRIALGLGC